MYRDSKGRFRKARNYLLLGAVVAVILAMALLNWDIPVVENEVRATAEVVEIDRSEELLAEKLELKKLEVLAELANCESGGHDEPTSIIIFDANDEASIGMYQFQRDTVIYYTETLTGEEIGRTDAIRIAIDEVASTQLAKRILFETDDGWRNWLICSRKLGLPDKIDFINSF